MRLTVTLFDEDSKQIHATTIVGGIDLASGLRALVGRSTFEMDKATDLNWVTAIIEVDRWSTSTIV